MQNIEVDVIVDEDVETDTTTVRQRLFKKLPFVGKLSYWIFFLTIVFLPLFVLPSSWGFQLEFAKKLLFSTGILVSFALWLITRLEDGQVVFPGGIVAWSGLAVVASYLISSMLSVSYKLSLFGIGYENDTFIAIVLFFMSLFLASIFFESKDRLGRYVVALMSILAIIGLLQIVQIFWPGTIFAGNALINFVGKFNDLGIIFGFSTILSLLILELTPILSAWVNRGVQTLLLISLFIVGVVNYDLIWAIIGVFSLIVSIYSLVYGKFLNVTDDVDAEGSGSAHQSSWAKHIIMRPSFIVLLISVLLSFSSNSIGSFLGKYGIFQLEVRPSWQSTIEVARKTMQTNLLFGSGPNTFSGEWAALKPEAVNSTVFWNADFNVGFGRIPSSAVTLGLVGILSFGLFLLAIIFLGIRAVMRSDLTWYDQLVLFFSFILTLYLWSFSIFYVTDTVVLSLTFILTGIFLASLASSGLIKNYEFSFFNNPRLGFISILILVILIVSTVSGAYLLGKKFVAIYNFQHGLYSANNIGNAALAENYFVKAINLDEQDLYYRSLSDLYTLELKSLLTNQTNLPKETLLARLQTVLSSAAGSARRATELDPNNYLNWMTLARVGQTVVPLKDVVAGSYDLAFNSYNKALALTPQNPNIYLSLGQLELAKGDVAQAKIYINQALDKKNNFTDALFLLSQVEANQGDVNGAIKQAEQAALLSPQDVGVLFQLGFLKYLDKDYSGSIDALFRAVTIQPNYSNAKYFLGLSYSKVGKVSEAISEFQKIALLNPDNQEVKSILINLQAGRGALENVAAPKNEPKEPGKRSKLPLQDSKTVTN
ncbi:MAG: tetratricopeptide repeat protein [Candidatus Vogelbacteria bacterium]|nr:tetratricopeptide repeat protein [Candidatus Vogelbacteria bacterium]